jgi:hypothetical protein
MARYAGAAYVATMPLAIFGMLVVNATLIVPGDAAATAANILASEGMFRAGIVASLLTQTLYIVVPLLLYRLLSPVNKNAAWLMVGFIVAGVPIAMLNELTRVAALLTLHGAGAAGIGAVQDQVMLLLELHETGITIASVFWGLWLLPMGYLVYRSGFLPRVIGVLLVISGVGYVAQFFLTFLAPGFGFDVTSITGLAEIVFPLWLLIMGARNESQETPAADIAPAAAATR